VKGRCFSSRQRSTAYSTTKWPVLPEDERPYHERLSSSPALDANLSPQHSLTATAASSPKATTFASLGTFTLPPATVDVHDNVYHMAVTERAV